MNEIQSKPESGPAHPSRVHDIVSIFPLLILYAAIFIPTLFGFIFLGASFNFFSSATELPVPGIAALITYIVVRLYIARHWGWQTSFALNWFKPRIEGPYFRLDDIISARMYSAILIATFVLLTCIKYTYQLMPPSGEVIVERIIYAFVGAGILPWLALRLYVLARFGWERLAIAQWAID